MHEYIGTQVRYERKKSMGSRSIAHIAKITMLAILLLCSLAEAQSIFTSDLIVQELDKRYGAL